MQSQVFKHIEDIFSNQELLLTLNFLPNHSGKPLIVFHYATLSVFTVEAVTRQYLYLDKRIDLITGRTYAYSRKIKFDPKTRACKPIISLFSSYNGIERLLPPDDKVLKGYPHVTKVAGEVSRIIERILECVSDKRIQNLQSRDSELTLLFGDDTHVVSNSIVTNARPEQIRDGIKDSLLRALNVEVEFNF